MHYPQQPSLLVTVGSVIYIAIHASNSDQFINNLFIAALISDTTLGPHTTTPGMLDSRGE